MNFNSFSTLFLSITIFLIFSLCIFTPILSEYGYISTYILGEFNNNFEISTSGFVWPTPRL